MSPARILGALVQVYTILVFVRAIFSWLPERHRRNEFYAFLYAVTEPALRAVRSVLPPMGGFDFSPLILIILGQVLARALGA